MGAIEEMNESAGQLVEKSREGCLASFEQLVRLHERAIYNYLLRLLRNSHDAEDAAQETFVKAFRSLGRYDDRHRFSTWLFAIARHTALSEYRKRRPHASMEALEFDPEAPEETEREPHEIWTVARRLKPKQFEAVWLHYAEEFAVKEVARIMGTNVIYVKVLLHRARQELKKHWGREH